MPPCTGAIYGLERGVTEVPASLFEGYCVSPPV